MFIAHGDDRGIILPPKIAPVQTVIVPIPYKGKENVNKSCKNIAIELEKANIRVKLDLRVDLTPGFKYYYWELRGIPIRIEVGPRDIKQNQVTVVRRDTLERQTYKINELVTAVQKLMEKMARKMRYKAWQWIRKHVYKVNSLEEAKNLLMQRAGVIEVPWCNRTECGHKLEEELDARVLGTPLDTRERVHGNCVVCQEKAESVVRVAVAY